MPPIPPRTANVMAALLSRRNDRLRAPCFGLAFGLTIRDSRSKEAEHRPTPEPPSPRDDDTRPSPLLYSSHAQKAGLLLVAVACWCRARLRPDTGYSVDGSGRPRFVPRSSIDALEADRARQRALDSQSRSRQPAACLRRPLPLAGGRRTSHPPPRLSADRSRLRARR